MADTITLGITMQVNADALEFRREIRGMEASLGGRRYGPGAFEVTATAADIPFDAAIDPPGWCLIRNVSAGESPPAIMIGRNDGADNREDGFIIRPGKAALVELETRDWMAEAESGTGMLEVWLFQGPSS